MRRHLETAYDWHGGQDSALYSFASCGGVVWSEDHRDRLQYEINRCIYVYNDKKYDLGIYDDKQLRKLTKLKEYVGKAKLEFCYKTGRKYKR